MALFSPWGNQQFFDDNGDPATGWKIYTYAAGSSTPLATYTTDAGTVAQSNPIIINSLGFVSNPIWLTSGLAYKLVLTNASNVVKGPPVDNVTGVTGAASVSQWLASGLTPTYVSGTSFTLVGDQTSAFHLKRRVQSTNTVGTIYSTITGSAYTTLTTVTVANDSGVLDSGLSVVNLGILTADNPSVPTLYAKSGSNTDIISLAGLLTFNGVPERQTVLGGPVDTSGYAAFGGATGSTTVTTTAISSTAPLVVTAANGFGAQGKVDVVGYSASNLAFTGLSTNGTMYGFVDSAAGALTTGTGTLAPIYQQGGTPSIVSGQFTFNKGEMKGYVGNGAAALQTNRVYVGQFTVAGGVVTAITWYALMGLYDSGRFTIAASTAYAKSHNLGCEPGQVSCFLGTSGGALSLAHFLFTSTYEGVGIGTITATSIGLYAQAGLTVSTGSSSGLSGATANQARLLIGRGW